MYSFSAVVVHSHFTQILLASLSIPQGIREPPFSCSYLKWNEDFPDSSIWKGPLASHCYHHTPLRYSLNLNLGRGQSFHCYYSWLRCLHQQIRSWSTAGSSCRQADGEPGGSAATKEEGESAAVTHRAVATRSCGLRAVWDSSPPRCQPAAQAVRCNLTS